MLGLPNTAGSTPPKKKGDLLRYQLNLFHLESYVNDGSVEIISPIKLYPGYFSSITG
jgi:hypothetical protein